MIFFSSPFIIFALSIVLGLVMSPAGDPYSFVMFEVILFLYGIGCLALGRYGRRAGRP